MKALKVFILLCMAWAAVGAQASQIVEGGSEPIQVAVSNKEMTRIAIEGGRIENINVLKNEADIKEDDQAGQIFILPIVQKPINVFLSSSKGNNYLLVLKPTKMTADSIVIREVDAKRTQDNFEMVRQQQFSRVLQRNSESYTTQIKSFLQSIASNKLNDSEIACSMEDGEEVPLWNEAYFVHLGKCSNSNLVAHVYTLTNISTSSMIVAEQELYKRGVLAVSIRQHQLAPNQSTKVYLVYPISNSN